MSEEQEKQPAINHLYDVSINISELKPHEKFVEFTPYIDKIEDVQFKDTLIRFTTNALKSESIPPKEERRKALWNLLVNLERHIEKEIKPEIERFISKTRKKYEKKYGVPKILEKIRLMQEP